MDVKEVFEAARNENLGLVKFYIDTGAVPANVVNHEQKTLAHVAAAKGELALFKYVVEKDPSILREYGKVHGNQSALIKVAIEHGSLNIVKYLVENRYADTFCKDGNEVDPLPGYDTALVWAAGSGRSAVLEYLIEKGNIDDVNSPLDRAVRLLTNAVESCSRDIIEFLVVGKNMKASLLAESKNFTLHSLVRKCDVSFLRFILDEVKMNLDIDQQDSSGYTLVHEALLTDKLNILRYLVEQKHANLNVGSKDTNETPLYYAVRGSESMCEYLVEHGADVNWRNHEGNTPLHCASSDEICMYLVERDAKINQTNNNGDTPLHCAIKSDREDWPRYKSCKHLIDHGADVNLANNEGQTPLYLAVVNDGSPNSYRLCKQLVEHGANINQKSKNGKAPMHEAVVRNELKILEYLAAVEDSDINAVDADGRTPLHGAAMRGRERVCEYLIERGADINGRDNNGWTPLHFAASKEHLKVCEYLVQHGADVRAKNNSGRSPKEETSNSRIIECMEKAFNSSKVSRSRRNVPSTFAEVFFRHNDDPSEYTRRRIADVELDKKRDCFSERILSASSGAIYQPQFQNFLTLAGLLIRRRKTLWMMGASVSSADKIDPVAEIAAIHLSQFDGR